MSSDRRSDGEFVDRGAPPLDAQSLPADLAERLAAARLGQWRPWMSRFVARRRRYRPEHSAAALLTVGLTVAIDNAGTTARRRHSIATIEDMDLLMDPVRPWLATRQSRCGLAPAPSGSASACCGRASAGGGEHERGRTGSRHRNARVSGWAGGGAGSMGGTGRHESSAGRARCADRSRRRRRRRRVSG